MQFHTSAFFINESFMNRSLPFLAFCAATLLLSGCTTVVREPVLVRQAPAPVVIRHAPPLIQEVRSAPPGAGYGWVQGHWVWQNNQWIWQTGHWYQSAVRPMPQIIVEQITIAPSPAHYWVPGYWSWGRSEWEWRNGRWAF